MKWDKAVVPQARQIGTYMLRVAMLQAKQESASGEEPKPA
jgi:hypothetical protein